MATVSAQVNLTTYGRLVDGAFTRVQDCQTAERFMARRAYGLFSKVMHYAPFLQAVGVERVILTTACLANFEGEWFVYTSIKSPGNNQFIGDVFVRSPERQVVAMMSGVRFVQLDKVKLGKFLGAANASVSWPQQPPDTAAMSTAELPMISDTESSPMTATTAVTTPPEEKYRNPEIVIKELISNYTGLDPADIPADAVLIDLGIDSLSLMEFSDELNAAFESSISTVGLGQTSVENLTEMVRQKSPWDSRLTNGSDKIIHHNEPVSPIDSGIPSVVLQTKLNGVVGHEGDKTAATRDPVEALLEVDGQSQDAANRNGYIAYESNVLPVQNFLVQAYILEAFEAMGVPVLSLPSGTVIHPIKHLPKHSKLVARLWEILQTYGVVFIQASIVVRGRETPEFGSAAEAYETFVSRFPAYLPEAKLMKLTGENLAPILKGEQDPQSLMFGSSASFKIMEVYYANSPMVSTSTDQLITLVMILLRGHNMHHKSDKRVPRILEVGAGTGGTTLRLAHAIEAARIPCQYTFTDDKLVKFSWINYDTIDLEEETRAEHRNRYDIVIGTNCVHATSSRVETCRRLRDCMTDDGVVILSERTQPLAWFDITFGLLDEWWVAENGAEYPLQPASKWMEVLQEAGFSRTSFTRGVGSEASLQQLLVGSKSARIG
ncbi:hypothetical protein ASPFODRAFT_79916 [Aspergillus luchuensis CBS 106.47]|uniref:Polyketide synthase-like phosphopantetheine-binding domain-containing protein n=1 Tax=Aspergillus luchuensis (strain CBS 106.47) TaxID=1137211 RepID=A0A1M3TNU3_ASPLC|nr:hypothetical protein ASPFODRAFT_79916 [Aspergillus luchuensis CBS 106.47]